MCNKEYILDILKGVNNITLDIELLTAKYISPENRIQAAINQLYDKVDRYLEEKIFSLAREKSKEPYRDYYEVVKEATKIYEAILTYLGAKPFPMSFRAYACGIARLTVIKKIIPNMSLI